MPAYEFLCRKCDQVVTLVLSIADYEKKNKLKCPECGSVRLERLVTSFQVQTSKKS